MSLDYPEMYPFLDNADSEELRRELTIHYETFAVAGSSGQVLSVYHAEPGSPTEQALALLSSIAATGNASAAAPAASG